jgi:uncharacterized membrane protein
MNIHPILVHFPIALLTLYAVCELIPLKALTRQTYWFYVKAVLVITGTLGGVAAYLAGEAIEDQFATDSLSSLVETHATFALTSILIFAVLALAYKVAWINQSSFGPRLQGNAIWRLTTRFSRLILKPALRLPLALLGVLAITITGALGGAIAFGPNIDPVATFFYHLLVQ